MMTVKAYRVYEKSQDPDDGMGIVFAAGAAKDARLKAWHGAVEINIDDYTDLRARREKWADVYADTGDIPIQAYLENGWWWTCFGSQCDLHVTIDNIGGMEDGKPLCERCAEAKRLSRPDWASRCEEEA